MRHVIAVLTLALLSALSLSAQRGGGRQMSPPRMSMPGSMHSNAPMGTPSATVDRDFGRNRAADVGQGQTRRQMNTLPLSSRGSTPSNAPARSPAASADPEFGKNRAVDVGQGRKKGLKKVHTNHKH